MDDSAMAADCFEPHPRFLENELAREGFELPIELLTL